MSVNGFLLWGFIIIAGVVSLTSAIIAAAPAIAVTLIVVAIGSLLYWTDTPSDEDEDEKPP